MNISDCQYANYCARRMRDGDHERGCTRLSQAVCNPRAYRPYVIPILREVTAEPSKAYCRRCGAPVKETGWRLVKRLAPRCQCGSMDIGYDE